MAITETYVDPAIAGDSGAGSIGDPYGDVQYALDTMTRDSTNGDRINIKAGTDEILGAALDLSTYGTPAATAQLIFQGYTTAAGDGGIGGISGAATYAIYTDNTNDYVSWIDLHLHNSGSVAVITVDDKCSFINCEVDNSTGDGIALGKDNYVYNCYVHNIGTIGISGGGTNHVTHCYLANGTNDFTAAISLGNGTWRAEFNIINVDGASNGIIVGTTGVLAAVTNNTIYAAAGTGTGISTGVNAKPFILIANNYVEGFSGAGGVGIDVSASGLAYVYSNRAYNNTTNLTLTGALVDSDNSATAASALTNPGGGDFSVGTDLKAGAYPTSFNGTSTNQYMDIGAAQRQEPAGGGGGGRQGLHSIESGAV